VTYLLWTVQGLLALLFLWTGGIKLVLPLAELTGPIPLPGLSLRFIGVCEGRRAQRSTVASGSPSKSASAVINLAP
jgi:hypothetical protein